MIVNATPLGLKVDDALPLDPARLDAGAVVMDILMTRRPTALLEACRARGNRAFPGFEMLIQQVPAYLEFFGLTELAGRLKRGDDPLMQEVRRMLTSNAGAALD